MIRTSRAIASGDPECLHLEVILSGQINAAQEGRYATGGRKGQTIVLDPDDGLVAADSDRLRAILAGARAIGQGAELVTLYYGGGGDLEEGESTPRQPAAGSAEQRRSIITGCDTQRREHPLRFIVPSPNRRAPAASSTLLPVEPPQQIPPFQLAAATTRFRPACLAE